MRTKRITSPEEAGKIIRDGGLVAFPTETVFGLGVDATNPEAVEKLFAAKGRPSDNPLIVHVSDRQKWSQAASTLTPSGEALLSAFAPGPLTVVLPKRKSISALVTAGLETVGLRIPNHSVALEILKSADVPVAAPSANRSGRPSCTTWKAVLEDMEGRVDGVFCEDSIGPVARANAIGIESTVVDCCGPIPIVLRPGAVTIEQIQQVIPETRAFSDSPSEPRLEDAPPANSPGLIHPHYQPQADVVLVERRAVPETDSPNDSAYCGMQSFAGVDDFAVSAIFSTLDEYAAGFYEFLREVDRRSIGTVFIETAPATGIGTALLDRQRRAAGGR